MKIIKLFGLFLLILTQTGFSQEGINEIEETYLDSIENSYTFQKGEIELRNGMGKIIIPEGFKYLDIPQSEQVLTELWGNPKSPDLTLGLILREEQTIINDIGYVFNIQYDEIGYVEDDDADDIDYAELLESMQEETEAYNKERSELGYETVDVVGWAAEPFYDDQRKILHWAKEIKFGTNEENTLNYNIRVLGRKGVIVLNAVGGITDLAYVQNDLENVLGIVKFNEGYKYTDFNPDIDEIAAWSLGGLVAGKILAKVGVFAFLLKFWKIIAIGGAGVFGTFWKKFKSNNKKEEEV